MIWNNFKFVFSYILKILKGIWRFVIKNWQNSVLISLAIIFFVTLHYLSSKTPALIFGGLILFVYGLINWKYPTKDLKLNPIFIGLFFSAGIIAILSGIFLPSNLDLFIFAFLTIVFINLVIFHLFLKKDNWVALIISVFIYAILTYSNIAVLDASFKTLQTANIQLSLYFYFSLLVFTLLYIFTVFILVKNTVRLGNILANKILHVNQQFYENNYFYLAIAVNLVIFIGGYFYLAMSDNKLRDFLVILGLSLLSSFGAVSSLKDIIQKKSQSYN